MALIFPGLSQGKEKTDYLHYFEIWLFSINLYKIEVYPQRHFHFKIQLLRDPRPITQIWVRIGNLNQGLFFTLLISSEEINNRLCILPIWNTS